MNDIDEIARDSSIRGFGEVMRHAGRATHVERIRGSFDLLVTNKEDLYLVKVLHFWNPAERLANIQKDKNAHARQIKKIRVPEKVHKWLVLRLEDEDHLTHGWQIFIITDKQVLPGPNLNTHGYGNPDIQVQLMTGGSG